MKKKVLGDSHIWECHYDTDVWFYVSYYYIGDGHISVSANFDTREEAELFQRNL